MELATLRDLLGPYPADIATWEAALAETVHMRVGSAPPALGKAAVLSCLTDVLGRIERFDGRMGQFWKVREALLAETALVLRHPFGRAGIVPCFLVVRARGDLIEDLRFYCDLWTPSGTTFTTISRSVYRVSMMDMVTGAQALASEKRLLILEWLKTPARYFGPEHPFDENEGVCGLYIAQKLGISPAATSTHLQVLTRAGLIRPLRIGKFTYFRRVEPAIAALAQRIAAL